MAAPPNSRGVKYNASRPIETPYSKIIEEESDIAPTGYYRQFYKWLATQTAGRNVPFAWALVGLVSSTSFFLLLFFQKWLPDRYFRLTDDTITFFGNYQINTYNRFAVGTAIVFTNTFTNTFIGVIVGNWIGNGVYDFKASLSQTAGTASHLRVHATVQIYVIWNTLSHAISIYFMFVNFWFIMVQLIASMIAVGMTTTAFIEAKTIENKNTKNNEMEISTSVHGRHHLISARTIQLRI